MKKIFSKKTFALLLSASMLLTACSQKSSVNENTNVDAPLKSEFNIAIPANPPSLDPQSSNSNIVADIGWHLYEPLFALNGSYEPTPVLAEGYTVDDDGIVYTINLRQGVKFHNGEELTADDVVASMTRWLELSSKANVLIGGTIFEKVDDYTVKMTVEEASSDIMFIISSPAQFAAIYPKSVIDSAGVDGITEYIGTGPYVLDEWATDQYVKLSKYEDYQSPSGTPSGFTGEKYAPTETFYFRVVTDDATRIAGVQTGQYDSSESIPLENYEELSNYDSVNLSIKASGSLNLFLNTTAGVLANPTMRQAVIAALNCDDIMLASFGDENLYSLSPGWANLSDTLWSSNAGEEYYNQNDKEKVANLLKEANYDNEKVVLVTTPDYSEMYKSTLVVQEQLRQAGINAEVESYDFGTFMERRSNPDTFDLFITSNSYSMLPVQLTVLGESWAGLDAPEIQKSISAIRFAASTEEAKAAWDDLQLFLYEYGAASVLGHYSSVIASSDKVNDFDNFYYPIYWNATVSE